MDLNLTKADRAIDALIEKRSHEREQANSEAELWNASERRYHAQRQEERRLEWLNHHRRQAEIFEALAEQHRAAIGAPLDDAALARRGGAGDGSA